MVNFSFIFVYMRSSDMPFCLNVCFVHHRKFCTKTLGADWCLSAPSVMENPQIPKAAS